MPGTQTRRSPRAASSTDRDDHNEVAQAFTASWIAHWVTRIGDVVGSRPSRSAVCPPNTLAHRMMASAKGPP
jgi:hypothetical protein